MLFNAEPDERMFVLPRRRFGTCWALELNTADPQAAPGSEVHSARTGVTVTGRSVTILKRVA